MVGASGVLATVVTLVVTRNFDGWSDDAADLLGDTPIVVYLEPLDDPRPGPTHIYAFGSPLNDLSPHTEALGRQLNARRATPIGRVIRALTLESKRSESITITRIRALATPHEPLDVALVDAREGGGTTEGPVNLGFDLDSNDLDARIVDREGITEKRFLDSTGLALAPGEKLRFRMIGTSTRSLVEWDVEIRFIVGGAERWMRVADPGNPFRVTAISPRYREVYRWKAEEGLIAASLAQMCRPDCRSVLDR